MKWRPIEEYLPVMGRVVVWLSWLHYQRGSGMGHEGMYMPAYKMALNDGAVWVDATTATPIETPGRIVTHFFAPESPESEEEKRT